MSRYRINTRIKVLILSFILFLCCSCQIVKADSIQQNEISNAVKLNITRTNKILHPAISVDPYRFEQTRQLLIQKKSPWIDYYNAMIQSPYANKKFSSTNLKTETVYDPASDAFNVEPMEVKLSHDAFSAYTQAVLYYLTGDNQYRANALRWIRIWSNLNPNKYKYYPDAHIHMSVPLYYMCAAAEIIKYTSLNGKQTALSGDKEINLNWTEEDNDKLIRNLINPSLKTFLYFRDKYFNQHLYTLTGVIAGQLFKSDYDGYRDTVELFFTNKNTDQPNINGALTNLFHQIDAKDPRNSSGVSYIQHLEMGRDENHAKDDILCITGLARVINNQGTKVDPITGEISTKSNAVDPYKFKDNLILKGTNYFYLYNTGHIVPWVQFAKNGGKRFPAIKADGVKNIIDYGGDISKDGRGRLNKFYGSSELYDFYHYQEGMTNKQIKKFATGIYELVTHLNTPIFYDGTKSMNYWGSYSDNKITEIGTDYWLSMPSEKENAKIGNPNKIYGKSAVNFSQFGEVLDNRFAQKTTQGITVKAVNSQKLLRDTKYNKLFGNKKLVRSGSQIALFGLDNTKVNVLKLCTNGECQLRISSNNGTRNVYHVINLPDTHNKYIEIVCPLAPEKFAKTNIDFIAVIGKSYTKVSFTQNKLLDNQAEIPKVKSVDTQYLIRNQEFNYHVSSKDGTAISIARMPKGMKFKNNTLTWKANKPGHYSVLLKGKKDGLVTTQKLKFDVALNRKQAYQSILKKMPKAKLTKASQDQIYKATSAVKKAIKAVNNSQFSNKLSNLAVSIKNAEQLNPTLKDGSLNYAKYANMVKPLVLDKKTNVIDAKKTFLPSDLVDFDPTTYSGNFTIPQALDFGKYRVSLKAFSVLTRTGFPNRLQGMNVYGSNDLKQWTKLSSKMTKLDNNTQKIAVIRNQQNKKYRYIKLQVDQPGKDTDPAWPGIFNIGEFHIFGKRYEINCKRQITKYLLS